MIRKLLSTTFLAAAFLMAASLMSTAAFAESAVYELRTYTTLDGKLDALVARFRDHTVRIFNKHQMESVGYWIPQDKKNTLIYILKHPSREAADKHWAEFQADPEWKKVQTESEASGKIVDHVDRVWMAPTDFSKLK